MYCNLQLERRLHACNTAKAFFNFGLARSPALDLNILWALAADNGVQLEADPEQASSDVESSSSEAGAVDDDSRDGGTAQAMPEVALAAVLPSEHDSAVPDPPAQHIIAGTVSADPALTAAVPAAPAPVSPAPAAAPEVQQHFPALPKKRKLDSMMVGCCSDHFAVCVVRNQLGVCVCVSCGKMHQDTPPA